MPFGFSKYIEVTVLDTGNLTQDGGESSLIIEGDDVTKLSITWPVGSEAYDKYIEATVNATNTKHRAAITDAQKTEFTFPSAWLVAGNIAIQLIMVSGANEWKSAVLTLPVRNSVSYGATTPTAPNASWTDLMDAHLAASNPHPQYLEAITALEGRVQALEEEA